MKDLRSESTNYSALTVAFEDETLSMKLSVECSSSMTLATPVKPMEGRQRPVSLKLGLMSNWQDDICFAYAAYEFSV